MRKQIKKFTAIFLAVASFTLLLAGCKEEKLSVRALTPETGESVSLVNEKMTQFAENYRFTGNSQGFARGEDYFAPVGVSLTWESTGEPTEYEIALATDETFTDAVSFITSETSYTVEDLFVNSTYYWKITARKGAETQTSEVYSFQTKNTPRTIDIEGVSNTRDLGGKITADGKRVKQGIAFRGANLDTITFKGMDDFKDRYGIKTDLDIREVDLGCSPLGASIQYINHSCPYYFGDEDGVDDPETHENLAAILREFADEENYPIYLHCAVGRDRTGIVSMLLLGTLGVPQKTIMLDYETTAFSEIGTKGGALMQQLAIKMVGTIEYIKLEMQTEDLQAACEKFLLQIGVTQEEIDSIKEILLEEVA